MMANEFRNKNSEISPAELFVQQVEVAEDGEWSGVTI